LTGLGKGAYDQGLAEKNEGMFAQELEDVGPGVKSAEELPSKLYFRIGEVSKLTGLKQHVLRYWESEFPAIAPKKMGSNHRMYRRKDVELLLEIKHLLYEKRYTIEGARKHLEGKAKPVRAGKRGSGGVVSSRPMPKLQPALFGVEAVGDGSGAQLGQGLRQELRRELRDILALLEEKSQG
jgi:DNA-binding transcriptional MerR regulator